MLLLDNIRIRNLFRSGITTTSLFMVALFPGMSLAATIQSSAETRLGGDRFSALLTIDDSITPGSLVLRLAVNGDDSKISIRGLASGSANDALLAGMSVVGDDVKRSFFNLGDDRLGNHAIDSAFTTCDMVVYFNKPTKGDTDRSVSLTLSNPNQALDLGFFRDQDFAVMLQVKGAHNARGMQRGFFIRDRKLVVLDGKIGVVSPVPEPTTALLLGLGLVGLSVGERRTRALRV